MLEAARISNISALLTFRKIFAIWAPCRVLGALDFSWAPHRRMERTKKVAPRGAPSILSSTYRW